MSSQNIYINSIDECVDNIIDSFNFDILDDKKIKKEIRSTDYILNKFNVILEKTNKLIDEKVIKYKINDIVTNTDNYKKIIDILTDYVLLYFFFNLSSYLQLDTIINLLNKLSNKYQINFFKNKYLAQYSIYYEYIKDYHTVFENLSAIGIGNKNKIDQQFVDQYKHIVSSINAIGEDIILQITKDKEYLDHNILKIIIFREIYLKEDKLLILKILESEELNSAEFKYIEIVDSKYDMIDYATIESLFDIKDIKKGLAEEVYQMVNDYEMIKFIRDFNIDTKINYLFSKGILIPITDEFLRYHKDSELYDKSSSSSKIDPKEKVTKKGDTKIRYIVTKVNKVKDYYNPKVQADPTLKSEIEKYFYQPLMYRKAIIINDLEEVSILRKLELQGKLMTEANEFYEDLKQIRTYPYIEFKFTNKDSFSFKANSTVDAIRYCNFEYKDDPKFPNIGKTELQYRVINDTMKANIVGVAMPRFNLVDNKHTIIPCHQVKDTYNVSKLHNNSFAVISRKLRKLFSNDKKYSKLLYWLFDRKNDTIKLELFDNINLLPKDDYIKLLLGKIYDEIVNITYDMAFNKINSYQYIDMNTARNILRNLESKLVLIPRQSRQYAEIMKFIYYIKAISKIDIYDKNEDKIFGVDSQFIKLPKIVLEKIALHIIHISKTELLTDKTDESDMYEGFSCQHIITWGNILRFKKTDPNKFNQELYNFIKKYVTENKDGDFVCKSCYQMVDLRKYTTEIYPGSDSIAISYGLETELETIPEYTKYTRAIKNMEKILEKICYSSNISYFVGAGQQIKFRRQEVIKNIIDIIDIQYKTLYSKEANARKERFEKAIKKYGSSMSNFFLFKLENDIFTYSSKETDKFKLFKMNNILTYMLIEILIEINLSQILYFPFDKLVNYFLFTKFGFNLFDNLYIRISNKNDIAPIKNYKLLCYVIYYISGIYSKFNMWYADNIPFKPNNINPQIQRLVIHTFVDAINSILEVNTRENKHYLYNIFATKFFNKLNSVYNNNSSKDVIDKLESLNKKKVVITSDKKLKYNVSSVDAIPLHPYKDDKFMMISSLGVRTSVASYPNVKFTYDKIKDPTAEDLLGDKKIKEISDNLYMETLLKIATLYNTDGVRRNVQLSMEDVKKLDIEELKRITNASRNMRLKNINKDVKKTEQKLERIEMQNIKNKQYVDELKKKFNGEIEQVIEKFVDQLESLIGTNVNINNNDYYLKTNAYVIDHDYQGNKKTATILLETDKKMRFKKDDAIFGQDIYYYDDTINNVTLYYSATERYLVGYKESSKDFVKVYNTDCYLKIHYSLLNQLKFLGFNYINYSISKQTKNINEYINNILRIRLQNLKNTLSDVQQIIYQVKNNFSGSYLNPIAKLYQTKIKSINTYDNDGERIFKDWNLLNNSLFYEQININTNVNIKTMPNKKQYIPAETLLKFMTNDDIILYYIIEQLTMLLNINPDNHTKANLAYMIVNIIFQLFRNFTNFENAFYDINVKKFYHYISSKAEVSEIHDEVDISKMSEEDLEKYKEQKDIDKESWDAIDADQDPEDINPDFGDEEAQLLDRVSGDY